MEAVDGGGPNGCAGWRRQDRRRELGEGSCRVECSRANDFDPMAAKFLGDVGTSTARGQVPNSIYIDKLNERSA
jgi:hypothetical protein